MILKSIGLFFITAFAELLGSYLMYLWLRQGKSAWLAIPAVGSLIIFGWLLTLHPGAAARNYAIYGGIYVFSALLWLWLVEKQPLTTWDLVGGVIILIGSGVIIVSKG